jgi:hypothetical protein
MARLTEQEAAMMRNRGTYKVERAMDAVNRNSHPMRNSD